MQQATHENVILQLTVRNHPGVMTHVCGLFARRAFNVEGILCLPIQDSNQSCIWLLVNDDQRLGQMISQIEKLEDVEKVVRNQSDPSMFSKIAVFFE
ncbi:TPA: acetolactate synthase small subunit [Klebsiella oxytoca]|uniref:acetolactate synthase small subunit n=1 Tax=Klebsiella TaxID=570 RepID=UPI0018C6EF45|nr:acetolactate synthase small subunit [Klebsiella oxytoca]ELT8146502.1 acetolactate synthase small subunit [Klebsiella oxytoca]ELT9464697.1 acetolactate synthase small subunit [Klebsiella oxytoca]EME8414247.1 acetolactate synthase small subunit [Klebsiella oxytoca]MBG2575105.1 acetolactate synthase small subunit [Klebsiella oxytoca]MCW9498196.1 acetolactate synthase small subunit [Klebsiella oxytoca]